MWILTDLFHLPIDFAYIFAYVCSVGKEYINTGMKWRVEPPCPKCGGQKERTNPYCPACTRAYWKERRKNPEVRKKETEYMREYRKLKKDQKCSNTTLTKKSS